MRFGWGMPAKRAMRLATVGTVIFSVSVLDSWHGQGLTRLLRFEAHDQALRRDGDRGRLKPHYVGQGLDLSQKGDLPSSGERVIFIWSKVAGARKKPITARPADGLHRILPNACSDAQCLLLSEAKLWWTRLCSGLSAPSWPPRCGGRFSVGAITRHRNGTY